MKVSLGCCYQCDVPPDNIQNLRICLSDKSVVFAHWGVQLQLEIFLFFFWVGPPGLPIMFFLGGPARTPHEVASSLSSNLFLLLSCIWDIMGYIKAGPWQVNTC